MLIIEPNGRLATFQYAHNLANALSDIGHDVCLATGIDFETKSFSVRYRSLEVFDRHKVNAGRLLRFFKFCRTEKPDVVHVQGHNHPTSYLLLCVLIRLFVPAVFVYTAQEVKPRSIKAHQHLSLRLLYRFMSHVFVNVSENRGRLLRKYSYLSPDRVSVVPLADLTDFVRTDNPVRPFYVPETPFLVTFFGNIEHRKGIAFLLKAFPSVLQQVPGARLLIAGKAFDDIRVYERMVVELGIEEAVTIHAEYVELTDIPALMQSSRVLVLPYIQGPNSGLIPTANAYHRPVVCSDLPGLREMVDHGRTGLLVQPANSEAISDAIVRVLADEELERNLIEGLAKRAGTVTWPGIARKVESVYCELVEKT